MWMGLLEWQVARVLASSLSLRERLGGASLRLCLLPCLSGFNFLSLLSFLPSCSRRNQHILSLSVGS